MLAFVRAAYAAALVLLLSVPAIAADKSFKRDDLADAAPQFPVRDLHVEDVDGDVRAASDLDRFVYGLEHTLALVSYV